MVTANMNSIVKLNWFLPICAVKSHVLKRLDANTVKIRKLAMMYSFRQRRHSPCFHTVIFQSHGYFWSACSTEEFSPHQVSYFHYAPSRSGKVITAILGDDFSGGIMCDGFSGYSDNRLPEAYWGTYLVHINRQFKRLLDPKITRFQGQSIASDAVRILAKVFHIEKRLRYSSASEKATQRRQHLKAMIDDFYQLIEEALTKSPS